MDGKLAAFEAKLAQVKAEAARKAEAEPELEPRAGAGAELDVDDKIDAFQAKLAELQRSVREEQAAQGAAPEGPAPDVEQPKAPDE